MSEEDVVLVETADGVMTITLNRPKAKNAVNRALAVAVAAAIDELESNDQLRAAIITGAANTFCSGMDLKAFVTGEMPVVEGRGFAGLCEYTCSKPLIAAVEGYALAGGTEILQGTDIRVAAENAIFGVTEVARGLYPMSGSTIRLRRQIPYCLAAEILLCGEHITAQQALDFGLINKIVPPGETLAAAREYARKICANGPLAVRAVTRSLREHQECMPEDEAMHASDELAGPVFASADAKEGMRAFKEKRPAKFTGN